MAESQSKDQKRPHPSPAFAGAGSPGTFSRKREKGRLALLGAGALLVLCAANYPIAEKPSCPFSRLREKVPGGRMRGLLRFYASTLLRFYASTLLRFYASTLLSF